MKENYAQFLSVFSFYLLNVSLNSVKKTAPVKLVRSISCPPVGRKKIYAIQNQFSLLPVPGLSHEGFQLHSTVHKDVFIDIQSIEPTKFQRSNQ